jgi:hypothetical protein
MQPFNYWLISWSKSLPISTSIGITTESIDAPGKEIPDLYQWWRKTRPSRRTPLDDKRISKPPVRFEKEPGSEFLRMVTADKKKYAAYYRALRQDARLEQKWHGEDQRNLYRLINVREFLWT